MIVCPTNMQNKESGLVTQAYPSTTISFHCTILFQLHKKKWKDFIGDDYAYFWDSFISNDFESLNDQDFVKLDDLFEIIKFINPEEIRLFLKNCEFYDKIIFVKKRTKVIKHCVLFCHKSYYPWIIFGWRTLEKSTPTYNSSDI